MKLENVSVAKKLWLLTSFIMFALCAAAVYGQRSAAAYQREAMEQMEQHEGRIVQAVKWRGLIEANVQRILALSASMDPAIAEAFTESNKAGIVASSAMQKSILQQATSDEETAALALVSAQRAVVLDIVKKLAERKQLGDVAGMAGMTREQFQPAIASYLQALQGFVGTQESARDRAKARALALADRTQRISYAAMAGVVLISLWLVVILARSIVQPLNRTVALVRNIAQGDLTQHIETRRGDEFGVLMRAADEMTSRLHALVSQVLRGSASLSGASAEIAQGNQDLSSRTENQASALEETAASMEELSSQVQHNADNARQASQLAAGAAAVAVRGGEVVARVVNTMKEINTSSRKISDIIAAIDGIAFQTNILALNAAVEAARAGEQGRGFAVVASEVRSLAGRSAEAAREIKALINANVDRVEQGSVLVDEAGATMVEVVAAIGRVSTLVLEISSASNEQSLGVAQVGEAVTQMDQVTQQNAALVEQMAAAASSLKSQAGELVETVAVFNLGATTSSLQPITRSLALRRAPFQAEAHRALAPVTAGGNAWESF